jgi:hypothetical protein
MLGAEPIHRFDSDPSIPHSRPFRQAPPDVRHALIREPVGDREQESLLGAANDLGRQEPSGRLAQRVLGDAAPCVEVRRHLGAELRQTVVE